jgi:hypothetical protein
MLALLSEGTRCLILSIYFIEASHTLSSAHIPFQILLAVVSTRIALVPGREKTGNGLYGCDSCVREKPFLQQAAWVMGLLDRSPFAVEDRINLAGLSDAFPKWVMLSVSVLMGLAVP